MNEISELYLEKCEEVNRLTAELKEYKMAEDNGLLLRLPCKVGDTLYRAIPRLFRSYVEIVIKEIHITENSIYLTTDKGISWKADEIGKTIFLTQEQAEQKVMDMERCKHE